MTNYLEDQKAGRDRQATALGLVIAAKDALKEQGYFNEVNAFKVLSDAEKFLKKGVANHTYNIKSHEEKRERAHQIQKATAPKETPQQKRDRIVEQAKTDVAELSRKWRPACKSLFGTAAFDPEEESVNFTVNKEKRTVVCYITYELYGRIHTSFRGIAKCAPTDCFNERIGKAISLRRALGIEVPAEYLNAPAPTEVRVGDVAQGTVTGRRFTVDRTDGDMAYGMYEDGWDAFTKDFRIIDDSRTEEKE